MLADKPGHGSDPHHRNGQTASILRRAVPAGERPPHPDRRRRGNTARTRAASPAEDARGASPGGHPDAARRRAGDPARDRPLALSGRSRCGRSRRQSSRRRCSAVASPTVWRSEVAMLSRGCAGWALAAVADKKLLQARRDERASAARWIASPRYEQLVTAFTLGEQFSKRRSEVIGVVQAAIQLLREDMIAAAQAAGEAGEKESRVRRRRPPASALFSRAISASLQCLSDLNSNVRPRLALEAMVVAWPNSEPRDR